MHLYYKYSRTPPNSSPASCICLKLPDTSTKAGQAHSVLIQVDYLHLCLYVFWQDSDEMLRYLHLQAYPLMRNLAPAMASHGSFTLLPMGLPAAALPILQAAPATE